MWGRRAAVRRSGSAGWVALAVVPVLAFGAAGTVGVATTSDAPSAELANGQRARPTEQLAGVVRTALAPVINVDGSLPQSARPQTLYTVTEPEGPLGIARTALRAYHNAADILASEQPSCQVDWALLASIGRMESNHARGGYVDAAGNTREPILGPVLDGTGDVAAIPDTDDGRLDGNSTWDRAVGPMQFIPSTWRGYGADANDDGEADPGNIYDAALAAGRYLCAAGADLSRPDEVRAAVFRYNHSGAYVAEVLAWAQAYRDGVRPEPDSEVPLAVPTRVAARGAPAAVGPPNLGPDVHAAAPKTDLPSSATRAPSTSRSSLPASTTTETTTTTTAGGSTTTTSTTTTTTGGSTTTTTTTTTTGGSTTTTTTCGSATSSPTTATPTTTSTTTTEPARSTSGTTSSSARATTSASTTPTTTTSTASPDPCADAKPSEPTSSR